MGTSIDETGGTILLLGTLAIGACEIEASLSGGTYEDEPSGDPTKMAFHRAVFVALLPTDDFS